MRQRIYGKIYRQMYRPEPIESSLGIQSRLEFPEEYIDTYCEYADDMLIAETFAVKLYNIGDRINVKDDVWCLIERKNFDKKNDVIEYFTNYTAETFLPSDDEFFMVKEQVLNEASKYRKNHKNIINFNRKLRDGLQKKFI